MRFLFILFLYAMTLNRLHSQDVARDVIEKVLFEKKVQEKVFFEYKGFGEWPHRLRDGLFAFILPDSIFRTQFPNILNELAESWAKERMLSTKTFIARPEGTVFITNGSVGNGTYKLLVSFDQIMIEEKKAMLIFHTTSIRSNKEVDGRYVKITARLCKAKAGWMVRHLRVRKFSGVPN